MKTPIQELLEWVRATLPMDLDTPRMIEQKIESMLEKEKEFMNGVWLDGRNSRINGQDHMEQMKNL
jgi:hypothetical protein